MFDSIKGALEQAVSGNLDPQQLQGAVAQHVEEVGPQQAANHLENAANNAQAQGDTGLAEQAFSLVQQVRQDPSQAQSAIVNFVKNNPEILQHFAPEVAQGILSKL